MSLIRGEDRYCRIIGILPIVSSLSFCCHRLLLMLFICSTMLSEFLCPLPRPHHFVVTRFVCHTCLSVQTTLYKFIIIKHRILNRAVNLQIFARQKQSVAKERRSQHDNVRRPGLEVSTNWFWSRQSGERRGHSRKQSGGNIGQP